MTAEGGPAAQQTIAEELQALRRGRGLRGDVTGRIGPLLREFAAGLGGEGDAAGLRRTLAGKLVTLAERLPGDLSLAVLAALALKDETGNMRTYERRREWVAAQIDRVPRTAERHINEAQHQLAQEIASELTAQRAAPPSAAAEDTWYIEHFTALYLLDGRRPEAIEHRVVRAGVDGLAELTIALDVPVDPGQPRLGLDLEVVSGGELDLVEEMARTRTRYVIRLPRPLSAGDRHEYATRVRVRPGGPMRDYYVLRPERRCDRFDLRVRFDRQRLPAWVRRVENEDVHAYNSYGEVPAAGDRVAVGLGGEAAASFTRPRPHFGSGLQWGWPAG